MKLRVLVPTAFLTFTSNTLGNVGALLHDVLVPSSSPVATGVPEPATLGLLLLGLTGVGFARRKRGS